MIIPESGGGNYEQVPAGTHNAICIGIVDQGTHVSPFKNDKGQEVSNRQIRMWFELPDELNSEGKPHTISTWVTLSMHERAKLRAYVDAWRGKPMTDAERKVFDPKTLIGQACSLSVKTNDKDRSIVSGIGAPMKAFANAKPEPTNQTLFVSLFAGEFDQEAFDRLNDKEKEKIESSPEWRKLGVKSSPKSASSYAGPDDAIPF